MSHGLHAQGTGGGTRCSVIVPSTLLPAVARNRRRAAAERRFWVRTLFPICHLQGQRLQEHVEQLAASPIEHPLDGLRTYSRAELERRIEALRKLDPAVLLRYCSEA